MPWEKTTVSISFPTVMQHWRSENSCFSQLNILYLEIPSLRKNKWEKTFFYLKSHARIFIVIPLVREKPYITFTPEWVNTEISYLTKNSIKLKSAISGHLLQCSCAIHYEFNVLAVDSNMLKLLLTHFMPLVSFDTPWKHQRTKGFLMFSGGIEKDQWHEMG